MWIRSARAVKTSVKTGEEVGDYKVASSSYQRANVQSARENFLPKMRRHVQFSCTTFQESQAAVHDQNWVHNLLRNRGQLSNVFSANVTIPVQSLVWIYLSSALQVQNVPALEKETWLCSG